MNCRIDGLRPILLVSALALALVVNAGTPRKKNTLKKKVQKTEQTAPIPKEDNWILVNVAAACLRTTPSHASQLETQATYGTPGKILKRDGEWYFVELPDGYRAWIIASSIVELDSQAMQRWKTFPRIIITEAKPIKAYLDSVNITDDNVAFDAVIGSIFEGNIKFGSQFAELILPDGRKGYTHTSHAEDFDLWSKKHPDSEIALNTARSMMGTTYLWGGTTPKAIDCSGLSKVAYASVGLVLPRNASQQAQCGEVLDINSPDQYRPGDLLFFGSGDGTTITHVGIFDGFTRFIHASGRVYESSFDPKHPLYIPRKVIAARRILNVDSPQGVTSFAAHPWYF